jgi:hypothetical protein
MSLTLLAVKRPWARLYVEAERYRRAKGVLRVAVDLARALVVGVDFGTAR